MKMLGWKMRGWGKKIYFKNKRIEINDEIIWDNPTELKLEQHEIVRKLDEQKYIKDLFIQSREDFEAAEILQQNQCNARAILLFQQANEKGLKALWLKRGELRYKIHNEYFMTHKLEFLTRMVLTAEEREKEEDNEIVNQARLMEELGRSKDDFRPLCIRARYATTDTRVQTQPWTIFSNADTIMA